MRGTLFIVATPIGNLEDMTGRAGRVLREVSAIVCEDTRVTSKLLARFEIKQSFFSLHQHSGPNAFHRCLEMLRRGESLAYVSDAGTPGLNDPGGKLVERCYEEGIRVVPIPGPSALTTAISVCGFPMESFRYIGFLPHKKGKETIIRHLATDPEPTIFLESTHRIMKTLDLLKKHLSSQRLIFIGRELTKKHETVLRTTVDDALMHLHDASIKGEFIVVVGPV